MNDDIVPATARARRLALIVWVAAAAGGAVVIWWLTSSLDELTELARTDSSAAIALFKRRVLPAFVLTVLVGVAGGVLLVRQGIQILRAGEFPPPGKFMVRDTLRRRGGVATAMGWMLSVLGLLLGAVPLAILAIILWLLRGL